ncbi:MAG: PAS domain S-box protein [Bacteroidales bacterium]|nr:PAS domain S-box protein [Candidatus Latescibacterota bacterium]
MSTASFADSEVTDRTEMMELLLHMAVIDAVQEFDCDFGLLLMNEVDSGLSIAGIAGIDDHSVHPLFIPWGKSFSGSVAGGEKPVVISDFEKNAGDYEGMVEDYYSGNVMSVPFFSGHRFLGLMNFCRRDSTRTFTYRELDEAIEYVSRLSSSIQGQIIVDVRIHELEKLNDELADRNYRLRYDLIEKTEQEQDMARQQSILMKKVKALREANIEMATTNRGLLRTSIRAIEDNDRFVNMIGQFEKSVVVIRDGVIKNANKRFEEISGLPLEELKGMVLLHLFGSGDAERLGELISNFNDEEIEVLEGTLKLKDVTGNYRDLRVSVGKIIHEHKPSLFLFFSDATRQIDAEGHYMQVSKFESVGRLAAGIAHEINTPMQFVSDNTRFLEESCEEITNVVDKYRDLVNTVKSDGETSDLVRDIEETEETADIEFLMEEIPKALSQSLDGLERISRIVLSLKEFSHPVSDGIAPTDINRIIKNTVTVARNEWKYVSDLETNFDKNLGSVPCVSGEISQVILNMIINASHAIGSVIEAGKMKKGLIRICTRRDCDWACIEVSDNGSGMPEDVKEKMFDPFFTTKSVGKGTGQGLAISRSVIVDKHGGEIECETEEGEGTTFIIRLPICPCGQGGDE